MNGDSNDMILKEVKSKTVFELIYEFIVWDYSASKNELDVIKGELFKRSYKFGSLSFILKAWLINFSIFFTEIYVDRWEFFEIKRKKIIVQIIVGLILMLGLAILLFCLILMVDLVVWKCIFLGLLLLLLFPSVSKTYRDYCNYIG